MTEQQSAEIERKLNAIPWYSAKRVTPQAAQLVLQHIERMRAVLDHLKRTNDRSPPDAYSDAQSAGYAADDYDHFWDLLYDRIDYRKAHSKVPIVLSLASHYFWKEDSDLRHLENPWAPIFELFEMGYTSTFDQDEVVGAIDVVLEFEGGKISYPLVGTGVAKP
jgi:hypothetical protein